MYAQLIIFGTTQSRLYIICMIRFDALQNCPNKHSVNMWIICGAMNRLRCKQVHTCNSVSTPSQTAHTHTVTAQFTYVTVRVRNSERQNGISHQTRMDPTACTLTTCCYPHCLLHSCSSLCLWLFKGSKSQWCSSTPWP